jgi:hypothetical protein
VKLVAIMSFFDERPSWLTAAVSSLAKANVDHLIAVDGPYALYPDSMRRHRSNLNQLEAIVAAAHGINIGLTLHVPTMAWLENEVGKRNFLFDLGRTAVDMCESDWFFIIDSDEEVERGAGVKEVLMDSVEDVAYYRLLEEDGTPNAIRGLLRWHPELCLTVTHYGFRHGQDGQLLWDGGGLPAANATSELILRHHQRDPMSERFKNKWAYYHARDEHQIERIPA